MYLKTVKLLVAVMTGHIRSIQPRLPALSQQDIKRR